MGRILNNPSPITPWVPLGTVLISHSPTKLHGWHTTYNDVHGTFSSTYNKCPMRILLVCYNNITKMIDESFLIAKQKHYHQHHPWIPRINDVLCLNMRYQAVIRNGSFSAHSLFSISIIPMGVTDFCPCLLLHSPCQRPPTWLAHDLHIRKLEWL